MKAKLQRIVSVFLAVVLSVSLLVTSCFALSYDTVENAFVRLDWESLSALIVEIRSAGFAWLQSKFAGDTSNEEVNNFPALYWTASPDPGLIGADISLVGVSYEQLVDIQMQLADVGIPVDVMPYETLGGYVLQCNSNVFTNPDTGERYTFDDNVLFGKYVMFSTGQVPVGFTDGTVLTEISSTFSGTIPVVANSESYSKNFTFTSHHDGTIQYIHLGAITSGSLVAFLPDPITINTPDVVYNEGVIAVYYDSYFKLTGWDLSNGDNMSVDYPQPFMNFNILKYTDSSGANKSSVMESVRHYSPESSAVCTTTAVLLRGCIDIPYGQTISNIQITYQDSNNVDPQIISHGTYDSHEISVDYCVPNCIVLSVESSEVLAKLEGIADQLVGVNETLMAMYGDIVSLLNDIYLKLGDIQSVEDLSRAYLGQILTKVNSMSLYVNNINIYSNAMLNLMQSYLPYLADLVASSDDIESTLETELSDFNSRLDLINDYFETFVNSYAPLWTSLLETMSGDVSGISAILSRYLYQLYNIAVMSQDIENDVYNLNENMELVLDALNRLIETVIVGSDGTQYYLQRIYDLLDEFIGNYSSGNVIYELPDGYVIPGDDGSDGEKIGFLDLVKTVISGIWHVITGAVVTFIGGLTGLVSGVSNVSGFFDFYRDGEIYDAINYGGGDIWD